MNKTSFGFFILVVFIVRTINAQSDFPDIKNSPANFSLTSELNEVQNEWLNTYKKSSNDDNKTKAYFTDFYGDFLLRRSQFKKINWDDIALESLNIIDAGGKDPFVVISLADLIRQSHRLGESGRHHKSKLEQQQLKRLILKAIEDLENRQYSFLLEIKAAWLVFYFDKSDSVTLESRKRFFDAFNFSNLNTLPQPQQRIVLSYIYDALDEIPPKTSPVSAFPDFYKKLKGNLTTSWLKHAVMGEFLFRHAWSHHKNHFHRIKPSHHIVYKDRHKKFINDIELSKKYLTAAFKLQPSYPEPISALLNIYGTLGSRGEQFEWFKKGINVEIDNERLLKSFIRYNSPKWNGSLNRQHELARWAAGSARYDTILPSMLIEFADQVYDRNTKPRGQIIKDLNLMPRLIETVQRYAQYQSQDSSKRFYDLNRGASKVFCLAYMLGFSREAKMLHQQFGSRLDVPSITRRFLDRGYNRVLLELYVAQEDEVTLKTLMNLEEKMIWSEADYAGLKPRSIAEIQGFLNTAKKAMSNDDDGTFHSYFSPIIYLLNLEKRFYEGEWIDLDFSLKSSPWHVYDGNLTVESPSSVIVEGISHYVSSSSKFPPPFTVELTVENIDVPRTKYSGHPGIFIGKYKNHPYGTFFWVDGNRKTIGYTQRDQVTEHEKTLKSNQFRLAKKTINTIKVNVWPGTYEIFINDAYVGLIKLPKAVPGRIGYGIHPFQKNPSKIRYKKFRIKKLPFGPHPKNELNADKLINYYLERINENNQSAFHDIICKYSLFNHDFDNALKHAKLIPDAIGDFNPLHEITRGVIFQYAKDFKSAEIAFANAVKKTKKFGKRHPVTSLVNVAYAQFKFSCIDPKVRDENLANKLRKNGVKQKNSFYGLLTESYYFASTGNYVEALKYAKLAEAKKKEIFPIQKDNLEKAVESFSNRKPHHH